MLAQLSMRFEARVGDGLLEVYRHLDNVTALYALMRHGLAAAVWSRFETNQP